MILYFILLLALLQIKHWYIDFVNQTTEEVHSKGIYGDEAGLWHSGKHGLATVVCVLLVTGTGYVMEAMYIGCLDFLLHYHIDWAKININKKKNYTVETKEFWAWLGFDQLMHQLTYLAILYFVFA